MRVELAFGRGTVSADVPGVPGFLSPNDLPGVASPIEAIKTAVRDPIEAPPLRELAAGRRSCAIVINDITRPCPTREMLEAMLPDLAAAGIDEGRIVLVIATGNHRPNTPAEIEGMIGPDLAGRLRVANHDGQDESSLVYLGDSKLGVPLYINRLVAEADLKIVTGLITPHHAAGYSGGRKSILPGVSGLKTLQIHHSLPIRPYEPAMGWYEDNPFHLESLWAARKVGVDFMVNTIDNSRREVVAAVAGDVDLAHRRGMEICRRIWEVPLAARADVVVTCPGGFPRDFDMHQSQKAVSVAELAVAPGGVIILVAECPDGIGKFGSWLKEARTPQDVIERYRREGYTREASAKAFMYARALVKHRLVVHARGVSAGDLSSMFMVPAASFQDAVDTAAGMAGPGASFLVIPHASDIIPSVAGSPHPQPTGGGL